MASKEVVMANSSSLFDKRVVQRSIRKGLLDQEQYQRMLDELPDLSDKIAEAEPMTAEEVGTAETAGESDGQLQARQLPPPEPIGDARRKEKLEARAPDGGPANRGPSPIEEPPGGPLSGKAISDPAADD
jgi:hypothetical protein